MIGLEPGQPGFSSEWIDRWSGQVLISRIDGNHYMLICSDVNISISQQTRANQNSPSFALAMHIGVSPASIRLRDTEDMLVSSDDGNESFKASEILNKCHSQGVKEWWRRKLWVSYAPAKSCWHSYIACEGRLPILVRIPKTGIHLANRCSFCHCEEETNAHVLINCKVAKEVWRYIAAKFDRVKFPQGAIAEACLHNSLPPQVGRFKEDVWRNCIDSPSSIKWTTEDDTKLRIWIETGLNIVNTIGSNRKGMLINIVSASTRQGPKIAGLSYRDDGQMGYAVIINARGRMHEGERAVLECILSFHKDYGGVYVIVSPIKEWKVAVMGLHPLSTANSAYTHCDASGNRFVVYHNSLLQKAVDAIKVPSAAHPSSPSLISTLPSPPHYKVRILSPFPCFLDPGANSTTSCGSVDQEGNKLYELSPPSSGTPHTQPRTAGPT
ncbi:hypothetical protein EJ110_NYTH48897 [Nymphaea thermarum]|nr:hypothetical protein EJ110_NYTH48897 [Nymphaea thermarum]